MNHNGMFNFKKQAKMGIAMGTAKTGKCLNGFNQETIQCMRLKLWLSSYDHNYFIQTQLRPILRRSCDNSR